MGIYNPSIISSRNPTGGENLLTMLEHRVSQALKNDNAKEDAETLRKGIRELAQSNQKTVPGMLHSYIC